MPESFSTQEAPSGPDGGPEQAPRFLATCDCGWCALLTADRGLWPFRRHSRLCSLRSPSAPLPDNGSFPDTQDVSVNSRLDPETVSPGDPRVGGRGSLLTCGDV